MLIRAIPYRGRRRGGILAMVVPCDRPFYLSKYSLGNIFFISIKITLKIYSVVAAQSRGTNVAFVC